MRHSRQWRLPRREGRTAGGRRHRNRVGTGTGMGTRKADEEQKRGSEKGFEGDRWKRANEQFLVKSKVDGKSEELRKVRGKIWERSLLRKKMT
ncbi:hypothetical protein ACLOJK_005145 [Asimina triloba]